ncbi:MAG: ABC transporter permease [Lachnospiraceae bacterium]|nr:ABC transporter permease [Lachnospiraceae bacterium]
MSKEIKGVKPKKKSQFAEIMKRYFKNKLAAASLILLGILVLIAIFAPILAPYDYREMNGSLMFAPPSLAHPFGTDKMGRDLLSRIIMGSRFSLGLGFLGVAVSLVFGAIFGSIAGFFGQVADNIVMRILDVIQAIPGILLAMTISTALGGGFINTVIALSVGAIPSNARMLRAMILAIRKSEYVEAADSINCSKFRIIVKHILPNAFSPVLVGAAMGIGGTIGQAAALSFVGLGIQPPDPEWGALLADGRNYIATYPHLLIFPGIMIGLISLIACLIADGFRDATDPRLKQ